MITRDSPAWALFERNPQPMILFDTETRRILAANDAMVASYGYTHDELTSMRVDDLRPDDGELRTFKTVYKAVQAEESAGPVRFPGEWRHKKKDGTVIDVEIWRVRFDLEGRRTSVVMVLDVTERRRVESALVEAKEMWSALVESTPDHVTVLDENDRIVAVNHVIAGYEQAYAPGRSMIDFIPPERRAYFAELFAEVRATRKARLFESSRSLPDGTTKFFESKCLPVDRGARGVGLLIVSAEVTERKRYEEALRASEERFRALVERADTLFLVSADGKITYANEPAARGLGFEPQEMIGQSTIDRVHPDDKPWVGAELAKVRTAPGATFRGQFRVSRKDGAVRWVDAMSTNLLEVPHVRAIAATYRDIDDRKRAEERLRASEERYRRLFDASPLPMWVCDDRTLRFLAVNDAAVALYGYSRDEFLAMAAVEIRAAEEIGASRHRKKDGTLFDVEVSSHPVTFEGRAARFVVVSDITEKRRLEEQLRQSQKMEAIGLLAGGIAHDFNNLLGIVTGSAELAKRQTEAAGDPSASLDAIAAAARRAAELTRKLLAFSKKQVLHVETRDLRASLDDFAGLLARVVGEDIELSVRRWDEPLPVRADASQLEQVLLNLCTNARQAMPRGGRLAIETRRAGEHAELSVSDSGLGMDEATRARVFEPFFTTRSEGTGLGLATVYGIVQQHGGTIDVESEPGRGTTFRVRLPIAHGPTKIAEPARASVDARGGHETLLVAEDEPALRAVMARMLSDLGYTVVAVPDGEAATREFERRSAEIALVILDVVMPKLGGPEAYVRMREVKPDVRVLFTTGYAPEAGAFAELVASGGHALLDKPFRMQDLATKVREAIDRRL